MSDDDLNAKLKAAAEKVVGGKVLTSKYGIDCFGLVDKLLRDLGGKSAGDFGTLTKDADYDWGDGIMLDSIQPGDILQFRNHIVHSSTLQRLDNGTWFETEESTARCPHHTAIVLDVGKDGSVTVVEQNVWPDPKKVRRSVIPKLDEGQDTALDRQRPPDQAEGDRLGPGLPPGPQTAKGRQPPAPGNSAPAGGARCWQSSSRPRGAPLHARVLGMEVRRPDVAGDLIKEDA